MKSFEVPVAPGLVVHADHFELGPKEYLLLVDGFSGWAEAFVTRNRTPADVMRIMRVYMSRNGIPRVFHSDQGSAFVSTEFRKFCSDWGIKATEGSAKHPRGNAIAEAYVKKLKHVLRTARDDDDVAKALLAMRMTPIAPGRPSPAELHLGRTLRGEWTQKVNQATVDWKDMREWKMTLAAERGQHFNRGTRPLPDLQVGQHVWVWHNGKWVRGKVTS
jgi:transposase InsO family protein